MFGYYVYEAFQHKEIYSIRAWEIEISNYNFQLILSVYLIFLNIIKILIAIV